MQQICRGYRYTKGGLAAHILRRIIHLASLIVLWLWYFFNLKPWVVYFGLGIVLFLEAIRLCRGWIVFGQRDYESNRISAFTWSIVAISLVLLFAPSKLYAVPIVASYALGDPLLGELRRTHLPKYCVFLIGSLFVSGIWVICHFWLGTPLWYCYIMGVITVAVEWPCLSWIDDNALMQLVPLAIVLGITR